MTQRGGDHWYNVRTTCLCFRAAAVVHALGEAGTHAVAAGCGISVGQAYEVLMACARRSHLYHVERIGPGWFASTRERIAMPLRSPSVP